MDSALDTSQDFVVHASRIGSLIEGLECGCLSHQAIDAESMGPSLWVV